MKDDGAGNLDTQSLGRQSFPNLVPMRKKGKLNCPDCNIKMTPHLCQKVVIDKCESCDGVWFDEREFGVFKRTLDVQDLSHIKEIYKPFEEKDILRISTCPRCTVPLQEAKYGYNSKVKIKKCSDCNGLWLPLEGTLNLVELAKISQDIAQDARGLGTEILKIEKERRSGEKVKRMFDQLNKRVHYSRFFIVRYFILLLPLYDENPRSALPGATIGLIALNTLVLFLMTATSGSDLSALYQTYALHPKEIVSFQSLHSLVTSMFMHGGFVHLIGNMFFLWTFGDNVEESFGFKKYILFYLFCGFVASLFHIVSGADSMTPTLGASGAVSGVLGAYLFLFPEVNIKTLVMGYIVDFPAWAYLFIWILIQVGSALIYMNDGAGGGVAWWAHIGGFTAGLLFAYFNKQ